MPAAVQPYRATAAAARGLCAIRPEAHCTRPVGARATDRAYLRRLWLPWSPRKFGSAPKPLCRSAAGAKTHRQLAARVAAMQRRAARPWRRLGGALLLLLAAAGAGAVRETKYYDFLGISPDADEKTIQKAYRRAAL